MKPNAQHNQKGNSQRNRFVTNWSIPGDNVRITEKDGSRVIPKNKAISEAKALGVDLVEIARPSASGNGQSQTPSVCRLIELGKLRYEIQKSQKKEKPQKVKEIGLHPNIAEHDLQTKIRHARDFLDSKERVVFRLQYRGREKAHRDIGDSLLERITKELTPYGKFERVTPNGNSTFLRGYPITRDHPAENNGDRNGNTENNSHLTASTNQNNNGLTP